MFQLSHVVFNKVVEKVMCRILLKSSILISMLLLFSCQSKQESSGVNHVVMCWLKDKSDGTRKEFFKAVDSLKSIPGVKSVSYGKIEPSVEPVADNTFDVGFIISFTDKKALDSYLVHPDHVKAVESVLKPALKKVVVYDFQSN